MRASLTTSCNHIPARTPFVDRCLPSAVQVAAVETCPHQAPLEEWFVSTVTELYAHLTAYDDDIGRLNNPT
jgi:hypothetical protein